MDAFKVTLILVLTVVTMAYSCPDENTFVMQAAGCLESFAAFAGKVPDVKEVCAAYKESKPCMDKLLASCGSRPPFSSNALYTNWLQIQGMEAYC